MSAMDKKKIMELRGKAQSLQATAHVGKDGITDESADEIRAQLKKNKLVKVRLLQSAGEDRDGIAAHLAARTSSTLVEVRGRTVVLARD